MTSVGIWGSFFLQVQIGCRAFLIGKMNWIPRWLVCRWVDWWCSCEWFESFHEVGMALSTEVHTWPEFQCCSAATCVSKPTPQPIFVWASDSCYNFCLENFPYFVKIYHCCHPMFYPCQVTGISSSTGNTFFVPTWGSSPRSTTLGKLLLEMWREVWKMHVYVTAYVAWTLDTAGNFCDFTEEPLEWTKNVRSFYISFFSRPLYNIVYASRGSHVFGHHGGLKWHLFQHWQMLMCRVNVSRWCCQWPPNYQPVEVPMGSAFHVVESHSPLRFHLPSASGISATVGLPAVASGGWAEGFRLSSESRSARVCLSQHIIFLVLLSGERIWLHKESFWCYPSWFNKQRSELKIMRHGHRRFYSRGSELLF